MTLPFVLPSSAEYSLFPEWESRDFVIGDPHTPVLEYSENFASWSDDLTALHEETAVDI